MIPLGPDFKRLRLERPRDWLTAVDRAMVLARSLDPAGLPSWGGIARVVNVTTDWMEYAARQDELRSRYRHLPWRGAGAPAPVPRTRVPPFNPDEWGVLETDVFQYPTFSVRVRDVLQPEHLRPCWYYAPGYKRLREMIPEPERPGRMGRPVLGVWWFGGMFPIDGWTGYLSWDNNRYVPGYCLSPEASAALLRLPRHASRPNGIFEATSRP